MHKTTEKTPSRGRLAQWASGLRFPKLLLLTSGIFLLDLLVPDLLPFVDEILLGLATLLLANLRRPPEN